MIPRIIHYCWFGNKPISDMGRHCISSWEQICPDYQIMRWDETTFDIGISAYAQQAYEAEKWAFVSDYVRLYVLKKYGGIYMDTDVELYKPLDEFLELSAFTGFENKNSAVTGIIASEANNDVIAELLKYYDGRCFKLSSIKLDTTPNTVIITDYFKSKGLCLNDRKQVIETMTIFPSDYFCPKNPRTGVIKITDNTVCMHHFDGSWLTDKKRKTYERSRQLGKKYGRIGHLLLLIELYAAHPIDAIKRIKNGKEY